MIISDKKFEPKLCELASQYGFKSTQTFITFLKKGNPNNFLYHHKDKTLYRYGKIIRALQKVAPLGKGKSL